MADITERLKILIDSSTPIVVMETVEEMRAVRSIRSACAALNLAVFEWSIASGLSRCGDTHEVISGALPSYAIGSGTDSNAQAIYNSREPAQALGNMEGMTLEAAFILKDFHRHMDDPVVVRRLRDVGQKFSTNRRTLIITAPSIEVPPELAGLVEYVELPLPDPQRLRQIIDETSVRMGKSRTLKRTLDTAGMNALTDSLRGLTEEEAERALSQAIVSRYGLTPEIITDVLLTKKELLRRSGMLDFVDSSQNMQSVGGLENLKRWLAQRRGAWEASATDFGLDPAKGVIILGIQGCGKSLCAQAVAGEWNLPLVKFDSAAIFDKYIGETEKRIQKVFKVAEGLAPCVLWIDELEKVFAGSGPDSASVDAGVSSRILASFLSWMQDREAPVFVAATCNNVTALPPELIRKGRFDELFFVDLPNLAERKQILAIRLTRRKRNPDEFDLQGVASAARGFSGAELDAAVQAALYAAFAAKEPLTTQNLLTAIAQTVPLSTTRSEEIQELRGWAQTRAVPASSQESSSQKA
ncbi:MAG TPA: AAA family ATPase [Terriglobales bacterium]|nr:AAA family ATPase [Terriglobales bacterium]